MDYKEREQILEGIKHNAYSALGITAEDESKVLVQNGQEVPVAMKLGATRAYPNLRRSVELFLDWALGEGLNLDQIIAEIKSEAEKFKEGLSLGYYEVINDAVKITESGGIKNIFELSEAEADDKKKPNEVSLRWAMIKRKTVDEALGWSDPKQVYHLAVEGEDYNMETASNYGSVRFRFDYNALSKNATFTEADSLNPGHLPNGIYQKNSYLPSDELDRKRESAIRRQISAELVPLAQAIIKVAAREERKVSEKKGFPPGINTFLSYIEAQVSSMNLMSSLQEVTINIDQAKAEEGADDRSLEYYYKYSGEARSKVRGRFEAKIKAVEDWCKSKGIKFIKI